MKLGQKLNLYLLWNNYLPADEREYLIYQKGWKQSYITLLVLLFTMPALIEYALKYTGINVWSYFSWYTLAAALLSQWAGGFAMRKDDLSLKKFSFFANKEFSIKVFLILALFIALQYLLIPFLDGR